MKLRKILKSSFNKSIFLLGPRKVGKSTFLKNTFNDSIYFDLLENRLYLDLLNNPTNFYDQIIFEITNNPKKSKKPIVVDEIQRIPILLNEIHRLIEEKKLNFILCGSSARKLLRGGANMLGGRAGRIEMRGLSIFEIDNFDLLNFVNRGGIPSIYYSEDFEILHADYIQNYLQEEIVSEALVRNLRSFNRFLELVGITNGEEVNYTNIARDIGMDTKTIIEYFQILQDTLVGNMLQPFFDISKRTNILKSPKFFLFDTGIVNSLKGIKIEKPQGSEFGKSFEHIVFNELMIYRSFKRKLFEIEFWRTYEKHEVDFVLNRGEIAIEVTSGLNINKSDLKGLLKFKEVYKPKRCIIVTNMAKPFIDKLGIEYIPLMDFVKMLWGDEII